MVESQNRLYKTRSFGQQCDKRFWEPNTNQFSRAYVTLLKHLVRMWESPSILLTYPKIQKICPATMDFSQLNPNPNQD